MNNFLSKGDSDRVEKLYWRVLRFFSRFGRKMHVARQIDVTIVDDFGDHDEILDLGGGGEGIIGRLRG